MNYGTGPVNLAFLPNLGFPELLIIFVIILLVFGANKLPKIAKDLGQGIREFKKSLSGDSDEKKDETKKDETKKD